MAIGVATRWFEQSFGKKRTKTDVMKESIMDFSVENGLCKEIWDRKDGKYVLKDDVREKLLGAADWAIEKCGIKDPIVRLIGSICSNAYEDTTDLDVHITDVSMDAEKRTELNDKLRKAYAERENAEELNKVGEHPIELYVQENRYRDLLSVGCYNLKDDRWECGPTEYPDGYDPYAKYFDKVYDVHGDTVKGVRDTVMGTVELGYAIMLADGKTEEDFSDRISKCIADCGRYLEECRNIRGALSEPKSEEEAAKVRESEEWKLDDAMFKLLGKYGYIPFMKNVADIDKDIGKEEFSAKIVELAGKKLFRKAR